MKIRVPVTAGPHVLGVTFPKKPSLLLETARQPYEAHFNYYRHPRLQPAVYEISIIGPYNPAGLPAVACSEGGRHTQPAPRLHVRAADRRVREDDSFDARCGARTGGPWPMPI